MYVPLKSYRPKIRNQAIKWVNFKQNDNSNINILVIPDECLKIFQMHMGS